MKYNVHQLEGLFPKIRWREPVTVTTFHGTGLDCRVCIANHGKSGDTSARFQTPEEFDMHFREVHA